MASDPRPGPGPPWVIRAPLRKKGDKEKGKGKGEEGEKKEWRAKKKKGKQTQGIIRLSNSLVRSSLGSVLSSGLPGLAAWPVRTYSALRPAPPLAAAAHRRAPHHSIRLPCCADADVRSLCLVSVYRRRESYVRSYRHRRNSRRRCSGTEVPTYPGYICPGTEVPTPYSRSQGGYICSGREVPTPYSRSQGGYMCPRTEVPTQYCVLVLELGERWTVFFA